MPYIGTSPSNAVRRVYTYTATAGQTTFTGASSEGSTLAYIDQNYIDVYLNGILLNSADYTSTSGSSIVLASGASVGDILTVTVYDVFGVADTVSKKDGGTFDGNVTMGGTLDVSGAFTSQGIDDNADATAITIDSSENVGIGTNSPSGKLNLATGAGTACELRLTSNNTGSGAGDRGRIVVHSARNDGTAFEAGKIEIDRSSGTADEAHILFATNNGSGTSERMRITSGGTILMHKTDVSVSTAGSGFSPSGVAHHTRGAGVAFIANRNTNDGQVISIRQANTQEGAISVSGSTVSYTSFSGTHWSRLEDNSKPTILRGTVLETIDEMCDWYQVIFTVKPTDGTSDYVEKVSIALPKGKKVGDKITYKHNDITYKDAEIIKENDEKHTKCQISDTEDSKRVYGVFMDWDNDDDSVNDMFVMAVGTGVVRISKNITVNAGDLLSSKGDGTAKVQDDDIVRSKTIGKVLTNIKQETYDDGSYTVPCALYCG